MRIALTIPKSPYIWILRDVSDSFGQGWRDGPFLTFSFCWQAIAIMRQLKRWL